MKRSKLSLCTSCFCMTYTIKKKCGKCKQLKTVTEEDLDEWAKRLPKSKNVKTLNFKKLLTGEHIGVLYNPNSGTYDEIEWKDYYKDNDWSR